MYGQCSRFFTKEVLETMEKTAAPGATAEDASLDLRCGADVKEKMRGMWE